MPIQPPLNRAHALLAQWWLGRTGDSVTSSGHAAVNSDGNRGEGQHGEDTRPHQGGGVLGQHFTGLEPDLAQRHEEGQRCRHEEDQFEPLRPREC